MTRFFGKIPDALRRFARGEDDPAAPLDDRADPADPELRAFLDAMSAVLRLSGAPEAGRDRAGALALAGRDAGGSPFRCTRRGPPRPADEIALALASPRPVAALGEEGLRAALRRVLRLETDAPGEGLRLDDARFEREVVYAVYSLSPQGPLGRAYRRAAAWCDGDLLLVALRPRADRALPAVRPPRSPGSA